MRRKTRTCHYKWAWHATCATDGFSQTRKKSRQTKIRDDRRHEHYSKYIYISVMQYNGTNNIDWLLLVTLCWESNMSCLFRMNASSTLSTNYIGTTLATPFGCYMKSMESWVGTTILAKVVFNVQESMWRDPILQTRTLCGPRSDQTWLTPIERAYISPPWDVLGSSVGCTLGTGTSTKRIIPD